MLLRTFKITIVLLILTLSATAQIITRSELNPYLLRADASSRSHSNTSNHIEFAPQATASSFGQITREQILEVPQSWLDEVAMIHIEGVGSAYTLSINGSVVVECEDSFTPSDYNISPYLRVGSNVITIASRPSVLAQLEEGVSVPQGGRLEGSYIYTQNRLRILDYQLELIELDNGKDGQLFIDVVVENGFNYPETIEVGFDVYDPAGKLLDFSTSKKTLEGNSIDTIRFPPYLYGAEKYRWNPSAAPAMQMVGRPSGRVAISPPYSVMLFTKRTGVSSGYIPFAVGYAPIQYQDGKLQLWGSEVVLRAAKYNASSDKKMSESELKALRAQGYNTIEPDYPQPIWFYEMCDKVGLWVIDKAAINAPSYSEDRAVGGTPSNDPALVDEYLERVQKMYYRTRNFSCVVAYSLGGESGNGYNMYKAYEWLRSVEAVRPIIYGGAAGEWNSDSLKIER
ncbi:MAG: glycoside hydrolase family 2 TIM barrel-domain containing protein [Rikenellaceae bacterium]